MNGSPSRTTGTLLITGGTGQLGRAVVRALVHDGYRIHIPVFDSREIEPFEVALSSGEGKIDWRDRVHLHPGVNLGDADGVRALFETVDASEPGGFRGVLHLAGGFHYGAIADTTPGDWDRMITMNATSAFLVAREALPRMKANGGGRIVMVSAIPVLEGGRAGMSAYTAAKGAVSALVATLAREGAPHGVTVNAVLPSILDTETNREALPDADRTPWIHPDEVAGVLRFLLSDAAGIVTGAQIPLRRD
jgi:NAD(P)-dependent dehydrogenase (short-subunit alcohol dehydrogenase family)